MNPSISPNLQRQFSPCSKSKINPEVASAGCLDTVTVQPPPPPVLDPIPGPVTLGTTVTFTGSGFTAGSVILGYIPMGTSTLNLGPFTPRSWTPTQLVWDMPASVQMGQGFAVFTVINTDQNYVGSGYQQAFLAGNAALNRPTITGVNGVPLHAPDGGLPAVYVAAPIFPGTTVTLNGTGFNGALVNFYTGIGNLGPLVPLAGATSTQLQVQIPANAPLGLGAFEVVNNPYSGAVGSQIVYVPIGDPPTITQVAQSGNTVTVTGTGFANGAAVNLFAHTASGAVVNFGPGTVVTVVSQVELSFAKPANAVPGMAFVQVINPPYIPYTATGNDPHGGFMMQ
jgi:hypothetical protein